MNRKPIVAVVYVALLVFAFIAAPRSCDWGLGAYFFAGLGSVVLLLVLPFIKTSPGTARIAASLGYSALGFVVWVAGLFIANFQILCRLF